MNEPFTMMIEDAENKIVEVFNSIPLPNVIKRLIAEKIVLLLKEEERKNAERERNELTEQLKSKENLKGEEQDE